MGVSEVEFVALTNDVFEANGKHYVTVWMRGDPDSAEVLVGDPTEIAEVGWFDPAALPAPLFLSLANLVAGRSLPPAPANLGLPRPASSRPS